MRYRPSGQFTRNCRPSLNLVPGVLCVSFLALLFSGCKEENTSDAAEVTLSMVAEESPSILSAEISGCGPARINQTERIAYLIAPQDCSTAGLPQIFLVWGNSDEQTSHTIVDLDFDQPRDIEFVAGQVRTVSLHHANSWRSFPNENTWAWRDGAGLLNFKGALYLLGGWNGDGQVQSEVWRTYDLEEWELLTADAPWPRRHGAGWLVHRNRMFVIGGDLLDDSWSSLDGINWRRFASDVPFGRRYTPNAISDGQQIFLFGGQYWEPERDCGYGYQVACAAVGLNDVWSSTNGVRWRRILEHAPWSPRGLIHGGVFFNGRIYVIGGGLKGVGAGDSYAETVAEFSDIWSSVDGVEWQLEATELGFAPRTHFAIVSTNDGCYAANGSVGTQFNYSNEIFHAPDCVHFTEVPQTTPMAVRHASSIAEYNGSIIVLGGHRDTAGTRIWQYFPN